MGFLPNDAKKLLPTEALRTLEHFPSLVSLLQNKDPQTCRGCGLFKRTGASFSGNSGETGSRLICERATNRHGALFQHKQKHEGRGKLLR